MTAFKPENVRSTRKVGNPTKALTLAVAVAAGIAVGTGTAVADPVIAPEVGYQTSVTPEGTVTTVLDAGAFRVDTDDSTVEVISEAGAVLVSLPLEYSLNGQTFSIAPLVSGEGRQLDLTPTSVPVTPVAGAVSKQAALDNVVNQVVIGWNNGGAIGTAIGAGLGFAIGCVSIFPNFISGCIIGTVIGTIAGTVIGISNANPQVQPAVFEYFTTP